MSVSIMRIKMAPLIFYISPYMARLAENSLLEVSPGIVEAAKAMGATTFQVVWYFLLPETLGSIVLTLTTGTIGLLGATALITEDILEHLILQVVVKEGNAETEWAQAIVTAYHSEEFKTYMAENNDGLWNIPDELK